MLAELEIHARLVEEFGFLNGVELDDLKAVAAKGDLNAYGMALFMAIKANPKIRYVITYFLYRARQCSKRS